MRQRSFSSLAKYSLVAIMLTLVSGCGGGPLSFLTGGGPNVAANVQAGQTNRQSAVSVEQQAPQPRLSFGLGSTVSGVTQTTEGSNRVRAESVQTVVVNEANIWLILFAVGGWVVAMAGWADNIGRWLTRR